jgi:hypothetical protein
MAAAPAARRVGACAQIIRHDRIETSFSFKTVRITFLRGASGVLLLSSWITHQRRPSGSVDH